MTLKNDDAANLAGDGVAALRAGNARLALDRFHALIADAPDFPPPWFLLAQACRMLGDDPGERDALGRYLQQEPRHLPSLVMMADLHARTGDDRAATSFYRTALAVAALPQTVVPDALVPMLRAGETFVAEANRRFTAHLERSITDLGPGQGRAGIRIHQSIDLLLGRTQLFLQQPSMFYFPGLPQRQFFERDEFAWIADIEAEIGAMQRELGDVLAEDAGFQPYVTGSADRPLPSNPLLNDPSWGAFYLWQNGRPVADNVRRCPATAAALDHAPMPVVADRSPMALFSLLRAGTRIQPHHGLLNTRLICHIPLVLPPDCALRVGNKTRPWQEGQALIFDDSIEHEAWNHSDRTRVVLLFEIWRPELTEIERESLTRIFEAIDTYG